MCGLQEDKLGKPGLQETNSKLWVEAKKQEANIQELFVSVSIDGKKIAVKKDGIEDMGKFLKPKLVEMKWKKRKGFMIF